MLDQIESLIFDITGHAHSNVEKTFNCLVLPISGDTDDSANKDSSR